MPDAAQPDYQALVFPYVRSPDQDAAAPVRHPVLVAGAGPVGLAVAIDLAQGDVPVVVLDDDDRLSTGSRAICFAKRTLEIFDRLGCGEPMVAKGVGWNTGRVFLRDAQLYRFDLLEQAGAPAPGLHQPAAILCRGLPARSGPDAGQTRDSLEAPGRRRRGG